MDSLTPSSRLPTDMELQGRRECGGVGVLGGRGGEEGGGGRGREGERGKEERGEGERGVQYNYYSQKMGGQFLD